MHDIVLLKGCKFYEHDVLEINFSKAIICNELVKQCKFHALQTYMFLNRYIFLFEFQEKRSKKVYINYIMLFRF